MVRNLYGVLLFGAGMLHFVREKAFMSIIPKSWPFRRLMVQLSGVVEVTFGAMLLLNKGTSFVKRMLPAFFIAVFPANINMAVKPSKIGGNVIPKWITLGRLPLQWVLIKGVKKI
ncbi:MULTISPECIES: hypothetical protein [unclassified Exiguobacterium]|uniref:DoxX family protein n=1 Tax=unclassified Exiguobacterium TaxID=2644629 RepID=UPI001BE688EE|nr:MULTISPECIES: hypothetical protein [unclassified Exiguobacterium]